MHINKQSIVIAESSQMLRRGLVQLINQLPFIDKIVELDDEQSLEEQIMNYRPSIVIVNPLLLGITLSNDPRKFLNLTKDTLLVALVYTIINPQFLQLFDTIISINDNQNTISEKFKNLINIKKNNLDESEDLTDREKEILTTLVKGFSNKEIADYHNISIHTVITHRRNITRKLNIHSPSGLTVYAIVNKLIDLDEIR